MSKRHFAGERDLPPEMHGPRWAHVCVQRFGRETGAIAANIEDGLPVTPPNVEDCAIDTGDLLSSELADLSRDLEAGLSGTTSPEMYTALKTPAFLTSER